MNWVHDPAPPASRRPTVDFSDTPVDFSDTPVDYSDTPASAIISASPGAPLAPPHPKKSRRRRRRRNRRSANQNSVPRSAAPVTPDERWANKNSASQNATQPQSAANDHSQMMSTPVYQHPSFHSSHLSQPHFPAANGNSAFQFGLDCCRIPGLYKPAHPDPRQTIKNTLKQTNRTNIEKEVTHWANNNSRSAQWYTEATKFELPPIYRDTPRHLAVTIHRLRLGYKANWEIVEPIIRPCEHCQTQTEYPLLHYLLQCPNTQNLRPHMQALDPANPEANLIAAGQVKDIMDNIETHIQTLTDFPPPR